MLAATEVLQAALEKALEEVELVKAETEDEIEAGQRAQKRLGTAEQKAADLSRAIVVLERARQGVAIDG